MGSVQQLKTPPSSTLACACQSIEDAFVVSAERGGSTAGTQSLSIDSNGTGGGANPSTIRADFLHGLQHLKRFLLLKFRPLQDFGTPDARWLQDVEPVRCCLVDQMITQQCLDGISLNKRE